MHDFYCGGNLLYGDCKKVLPKGMVEMLGQITLIFCPENRLKIT